MVSYDAYTNAGRKQQVTYLPGTPDQQGIGYGYDAAGRLSSLTTAAGTFGFGYDARSRRDSLTYPNGAEAAYSYRSDRDWLTGISYKNSGGTDLATIAYPQHDLLGNRLQKIEDGTPTVYGYDDLYQTTSAASGGNTENYVYDPVGNRQFGPGGMDSYQHDAANRMTSGRNGGYAHDDRGNRISGDGWTYSWNGENRLIGMSNGTTTVAFKYDPFGRRVEKTVNGISTRYLYDGEDLVFAFGPETTHFIHGPGIDEPLALVRNGQSVFYHADGLGSIIALTDSPEAVVQRYAYSAFGEATAATGFQQPYGFTGRELDGETGLMFYRARYFDPTEGRWLSKDPIGLLAGDVNFYRYVGNNVPNFTDPWGLMNTEMVLGGIGEMAGGAVGVIGAAYVTGQSGGASAPITVPITVASVATFGHGAAKFVSGIFQDNYIDIPSISLTYQTARMLSCHETANAIDGGVDILLQFGILSSHAPTTFLESTHVLLDFTNSAIKVVPVLNGTDN